jgi:hypothetical protein
VVKFLLIKMMTFPNRRGRECFVSSLANLAMIVFGDFDTASKIYHESRVHPLVLPDGGTFLGAWPRLVSDLSGNKYVGTVVVSPDYLERALGESRERYDAEQFSLYERALDESLQSGLVDLTGVCQSQQPVILSIGEVGRQATHAILDLRNGKVVDDGVVCYRNVFSDQYHFGAILKVTRTNECASP